MQVTEHWHRLPRGYGVSLETFRSYLDVGLRTAFWMSLLEQELSPMDTGSCQPQPLCDFVT